MEKIKFTSTLKGDDIEIVNFRLKENQQIISKKCSIKWSIEPQVEGYGIRYWRTQLESFSIEMEIEDIDEQVPKGQNFDTSFNEFELEINSDNYKMKDDFVITRIEIDKKDSKAIAYIQG